MGSDCISTWSLFIFLLLICMSSGSDSDLMNGGPVLDKH